MARLRQRLNRFAIAFVARSARTLDVVEGLSMEASLGTAFVGSSRSSFRQEDLQRELRSANAPLCVTTIKRTRNVRRRRRCCDFLTCSASSGRDKRVSSPEWPASSLESEAPMAAPTPVPPRHGGDANPKLEHADAIPYVVAREHQGKRHTQQEQEQQRRQRPNLRAYWGILRPHNIPSSFGLVAAGALVASHSPSALLDTKVLLTASAAASVAVGSCVLNDWFDVELDRVNKPDRPLVTGEVVPHHALAIGLAFLAGALASAWAVHPAALQGTIVASVGLTSAYTPVLKPIPLVKNVLVAAVVGAAIAAGGLAAGAGVASTAAPSLFTFMVIAHREIMMDMTDAEGDKANGVQTLPVVLGGRTAIGLATLLLTAGVGAAEWGIASATGMSDGSRGFTMILAAAFVVPLYTNILEVGRSGFQQKKLATAVEQALGPLALVLGLMGLAVH